MTFRIKLKKIITSLFLLSAFSIFSQKIDHVLGDVLVQLHPQTDIQSIARDFRQVNGTASNLHIKQHLVPYLNIWLIQINPNEIDEIFFLEKIKKHPAVANAQFNHLTALRSTIPNDTDFPNQWQHLNDGNNGSTADADMDTDLAWDITTGGLTAVGDTIVVCVIDAGIDQDHDDLKNNLWYNFDEIPNNGIDDDNNGFTDDFQGWNSFSETDNINNNDDHGSAVTGIIGAQGNNNIGVAGVNWNVKIMTVVGGSGIESEVLVSYSYPLSHRVKYNQTNGEEGAFVVATNASWGKDEGMAADHPLWCAMYDSLGAQGILNCGATANDNFNVEVDGDMPTTCVSDFLIGVTNTTSEDLKHPDAGYGEISIDLGAPGAMSWSTESSNNYGTFGGTSASTPQVTGAIGLLYAAPCTNLPSLALNDPPAAALLVKDYILNGVDPNDDLDGITFTGGRLNVFNSLQMLLDSCGRCPAPSSLTATNILDESATLTWIESDSSNSVNLRYREVSGGDWIMFTDATAPFQLTNLTGCTDYEVQVESICSSEQSGFVYSHFFTTDDCCISPSDLSVVDLGETFVSLAWSEIFAASSYYLELTSPDPDFSPQLYNITSTSTQIFNLPNCMEFEISIQSECDTGFSIYSDPISFATTGCGACRDLEYCEIESEDASAEWIANVIFNTLENESESNNGYGDFTSLEGTEVMAGQTYTISISPGYSGSNFLEYFRAWIDYNQDGDFEDLGEQIFNTPDDINTTASGEVTIPSNAVSGATRMRVLMRWGGSNMSDPPPCQNIDFGEIEDYCVSIVGGNGIPCAATTMVDTSLVDFSNITLNWLAPENPYESFIIEYRPEGSSNWIVVSSNDLNKTFPNLEKCTYYEFKLQTICDSENSSDYTEIYRFSTQCDVSTDELEKGIANVKIYPNPFAENLSVSFDLKEKTNLEIQVFSANGQSIFATEKERNSGTPILEFPELNNLPQGIYFLKIKTLDSFLIKKIVKR